MTQEERQKEKELLLNVLKDGLPYGLQLQITDVNEFTFNGELCVLSKNWCKLNITDPVKRTKVKNQTIPLNYIYIKPYLRPMSSMTTDEEYEYYQIKKRNSDKSLSLMNCSDHLRQLLFPIIVGTESIGWLNAHHFDYRGLIEKGLALEAPEDMYKEK